MAAENEPTSSSSSPPPPPPAAASSRPTLILPPRSTGENLFIDGVGASPGPMTLVSSFFSENDPDSEYRSFSQLLAGAMGSPVAVGGRKQSFLTEDDSSKESGTEKDFRLKQNRPLGLVIAQSPMFTVPPGLSPATLLDSPGFFSSTPGAFGMSHQQALAQVTAQAAQSQSHMYMHPEYPSTVLAPHSTSLEHHTSYSTPPLQLTSTTRSNLTESPTISNSDQRSQPPSIIVDKPAEDGYNWRKYGQKQVKGSEFPRSYYKCTHSNCPVKKKVERSLDGHVTEIIYKGQHNHEPPPPSKRTREGGNTNGILNFPGNSEMGGSGHGRNLSRSNEYVAAPSRSRRDQTSEQLSGSSDDDDEVGNAGRRVDKDDDERDAKRRNTEVRVSEPATSHRAVTEPRIIVQTTSEVDLLDDGYRWRKYGQKVVKGNPHPRSYYKCTSAGCNVRKHVERASTDPKAVITTYEGKHNHDVPAAKHSSHSTANSNMTQHKLQNVAAQKHASVNEIDFGSNDQQPVALLRFKEEQVS